MPSLIEVLIEEGSWLILLTDAAAELGFKTNTVKVSSGDVLVGNHRLKLLVFWF